MAAAAAVVGAAVINAPATTSPKAAEGAVLRANSP